MSDRRLSIPPLTASTTLAGGGIWDSGVTGIGDVGSGDGNGRFRGLNGTSGTAHRQICVDCRSGVGARRWRSEMADDVTIESDSYIRLPSVKPK
jgi:hypothetical protein